MKALLVLGVLWLGFVLIVWAVITGRTGVFDETGLLFWRYGEALEPRGFALLLEMVCDVTVLGGVLLRNLIAIGAVVALLFLRLWREVLLLTATVMLGWLVNIGVKHLVGRDRPEIVLHLMEVGGASFLSGYSFNAAVVYIGIAFAFATLSARQSVRFMIIGVVMVLSVVVVWSWVWLGVHFPSDVAAGWFGGAGWAFLAVALFQGSVEKAADSETVVKLDSTELARI